MKNPVQKFNPWPVALIAYFAVFITGIVAFTTFASRQKIDLVSPDYYEDEVRFQQQIDRAARTRMLLATTTITYQAGEHRLNIKLPVAAGDSPSSGIIHLYRPADASLDQKTPLALDAEGVQHIDTRRLKGGLWKVRVLWKTQSQDYSVEQAVIIALPRA